MTAEELLDFIREQGGQATSTEIVGAGFSPSVIAALLAKGQIERPTRGVYALAGESEDKFAAISMRWKKCVFCNSTALYLHGLTTREPETIDVAVPRGYNPSGFKGSQYSLHVYRAPEPLYKLGLSSVVTPKGNIVPAYDRERCLCDALIQRRKGGIDPRVFADAVKGYFQSPFKDIPKLTIYAKKLGVYPDVKAYLDVMS